MTQHSNDHPLTQIRVAAGLTTTDFALALATDVYTVSGAERGYKALPKRSLAILAERGVDIERYLVDCAAWQAARREALGRRINRKEVTIPA